MAPIFTGLLDVVGLGVVVAVVGVAVGVAIGVGVDMAVGVSVAVTTGVVVGTGVFSPPFPPQAGTSTSSNVTTIKSKMYVFDFNICSSTIFLSNDVQNPRFLGIQCSQLCVV